MRGKQKKTNKFSLVNATVEATLVKETHISRVCRRRRR